MEPPTERNGGFEAHKERRRRLFSPKLTYGRGHYGQRFVRLSQITLANVDRLHPAWAFAAGGDNRGVQATPLIFEGALYVSADQCRVFALDARTGRKK